ncbi:MAG: sortase [Anaerolineales bacterium]
MLVFLGITNAATVVLASIQAPPADPFELLDQPDRVVKRNTNAGQEFANFTHSDAWFMAPAETDALMSADGQQTRQLLSALYEDERIYGEQRTGQASTLPSPLDPEIPIQLIIPAIGLEAPILSVEPELATISGQDYQVWRAPDKYGVGWHANSAPLGVKGNTVLNGHHNVNGEVFKRLEELEPGDEFTVLSGVESHHYVIVNRMILKEKYVPIEERLQNAQWILPSEDERLTLITCWPYESNTHRLVLVAKPVAGEY